MKKPKPITLADLRRAAPKGWKASERRLLMDEENGIHLWRVEGVAGGDRLTAAECVVWHPDRQLARRTALAALKAMKGET